MNMQETYNDVLARAHRLSVEEKKRLIEELLDDLTQLIEKKPKPRYSILDFEGVARGTWDDVGGVDEFLKQERASWDG